MRYTMFFIAALLLLACGNDAAMVKGSAIGSTDSTAIYYNGDILTMESDTPEYAEAIAIKKGKIMYVGSKDEALKIGGATHQLIDLKGKTLMPAFMDAHSHYISSLSVANQVNLYPPPAGPGKDVQSIVAALVSFRNEHKVPKGVLIQGYGYDENVMPGGRQLNRDDLDKALPDNPVLVGHVSMHGAVLNTAALKKWNISADTKTPPGGIIVRKPGSNEPYGLIMETAYLPIFASLPKPTPEQEQAWSQAGQQLYAMAGITTAHEGATHIGDMELMQRASAAGSNIIDVIAYPFITDVDTILKRFPIGTWGQYNNRFKIGGVKVTIDGSPQGRTAYFTTPYLKGGPNGEKKWQGELTFDQATINAMVKKVYDLGVPLNLHANGDGAIDAFFKAHEYAAASNLKQDRKVTIIHSQFVRKDQLDKYRRYKVTPSLYTLHTYYFAEAHTSNRGALQASYISPMRDAIDHGLRPTNHTDFYVAPLDQLFMLWSAVNRISREGKVIGPAQRVSAYEGLMAMTINVARQYQEENTKGSLKAGKLADLVVLDKNPLKVMPQQIKEIKVETTIKEGKAIYHRRKPV